jgi:hypothetical protein
MTMIIDGTNGLTFNNATTQASAGVVLQVVSSNYTSSNASTSSTSFVSTTFSASITPKFSTSKILIIYTGAIYLQNSTGQQAYQTIYRNSTNLGNTNGFVEITGANFWYPSAINYLDSPATTSSTTYTLYHKVANGGVSAIFGGDSIQATITLMEIAG